MVGSVTGPAAEGVRAFQAAQAAVTRRWLRSSSDRHAPGVATADSCRSWDR